MSENKKISNKRVIVFISTFIALYIAWVLTNYAFEEGIIFWNFNFSLNLWDIVLNSLLLIIVVIGWILFPGRLFYIVMRKTDDSKKIGDIVLETMTYFICIILVFLVMSMPVVSYSPGRLNEAVGEGTHMAKFGQKLYNGIWFSGTVGNEKGCGVTLGSDPIYPFTERGEIFTGESAIVDGYSITKKGEFHKEITERINVTLLEIDCPKDSMLSRGIFEIKKVDP